MQEKRNTKKLVIIGIIITIIICILGLAIYDRVTINNMYYISEKNLEIPIFLYHNIVKEPSEIEYDYMQTTAKTFEEQITGLQNVGYHFISYDDLKQYKNGSKKIYKKSCLLTFDDGCIGVYENAYPILQKYNIPFTMFIITDNMGTYGAITWDEAKEMKDSGLATIASHSINHPKFDKLSTKDAVDNVNKSYEIIEEKLGNVDTKIFTYPYGLYTDEEVKELEKEGYIENLTDNKINKSNNLNLSSLHRCYPLNDSVYKIIAKKIYRSIRY